MASSLTKKEARIKKKRRIRKRLFGTSERPRLSVFKSAKHIYAQIIDDTKGHTIASASSLDPSVKTLISAADSAKKTDVATIVGKSLAEIAVQKGVQRVVFDRNGFLYHGRIKAVSQGAREGGLDF